MSVSLQARIASLLLLGLCLTAGALACKTSDNTRDSETLAEPDEALGYLEDARDAVAAGEVVQAETMLELAGEAGADPREVAEIRARLFRNRAERAVSDDDPRAAYEWSLRAAEIEPLDGKRFEDLMRALDAGESIGEPPATLAELADRATQIVMASRTAHEKAAQFWDDAARPKRALPHYQWLHKVSPGNISVTTRLAAIYAQVGEVQQAERLLENVHAERPDNVQVALKLASLYEQTERPAEARKLYETLLEAFPDNSGLYFRYARFLDRVGESELADEMRAKAREKLPGVERRDMRRLR
ncbi:MAG: tetratricopeptide repeat protein [Myxococcota bacterium]